MLYFYCGSDDLCYYKLITNICFIDIAYKFVDLRSSQSNDIEPTLEMTQQYNEEDLTHGKYSITI